MLRHPEPATSPNPFTGSRLGGVPSLLGLEGQAKTSNSLDNAIFLSDPAEVVAAKARRMSTDPQRVKADIPGRVEGNPVFQYDEGFKRNRAELKALKVRYRREPSAMLM
jgi:tryptophanyl-tRNA synthetase